MKTYNPEITLIKNGRGCYILDTIKGCSICGRSKPLGCYDNCYAKNIASRYGFDFSHIVERDFVSDNEQIYFNGFTDTKHESRIIKELKSIDMPFVRIGEMGDPSENWEHTISICKTISLASKRIVIITKHWKAIPESIMQDIVGMDICINTSISALDSNSEIEYRLLQYGRLKNVCNSVLRIVSCDFNTDNEEGKLRDKIQRGLFENEKTLDTVFRPSMNNKLVTSGIINIDKVKFLKGNVIASMYNKNAYFGMCDKCPDMCGVNL